MIYFTGTTMVKLLCESGRYMNSVVLGSFLCVCLCFSFLFVSVT